MDKNTFQYSYCAKQQEEIKAIRKKYVQPEPEDKMTQLRRLDGAVNRKANTVALIVGIIGALIMGTGMSLFMSDFGKIFGTHQMLVFPVGICLGLLGMVLMSCAYPLYNRTIRKERQRIASQILQLTEELMK